MRQPFALAAMLIAPAMMAQLSWTPCTMPVNTLTLLAMGPYGELVTLLNSSPAQVRVSTDQGASWENHPGSGGPNGILLSEPCLHVTNTGAILIWGSVNGGSSYQMWRSADGGNTFSSLGVSAGVPASRYFFGLRSGPNGDVYAYGEGVLRSTDDGQNWTSIVPASTPLADVAANTTHLYGTFMGTILRGGLDGSGFAPIATSGYNVNPGNDLARVLNERMIAVGGGNKVITTTDDGANWTSAALGITSNELAHVAGTLFNDTWVAAKQNDVFVTFDAGGSWTAATDGTSIPGNEPILDVLCDSTGNFYIFGYSYLYRAEINTALAPELYAEALPLHPNPTGGMVWLESSLAGRSCQVTDMTGRTVLRTRVDGNGAIDLTALENGRYVITVQDGGRRGELLIQR